MLIIDDCLLKDLQTKALHFVEITFGTRKIHVLTVAELGVRHLCWKVGQDWYDANTLNAKVQKQGHYHLICLCLGLNLMDCGLI